MERGTGKPKRNEKRRRKPRESFDQWVARSQQGLKILNASLKRKLTKSEQAILNSFDPDLRKHKVVAKKPPNFDASFAAMKASIEEFAKSVQDFVDSRKKGRNGNGRKRTRLP